MTSREDACYLAMWNGAYGAERAPANYQRRDDGSHIFHNAEEYYEWWYFDAAFTNGYHVVATYHYRNIFLKPMVPSVQLFVYAPDGRKIERYALVDPAQASANPDYCDVRMGDHWVRDHGDRYELAMHIQGVGVHLTFRNRVPPWKPGTGFNYKDEAAGLTAGWVVPVPHARVEGQIVIEDQTLPVQGSGYHDHNWGNYHCHRTFAGWYWGRVHDPRITVDYGWVLPRRPSAPVVAPLLVARENAILLSTNRLTVDLEDPQPDEATGQIYARKLVLQAAGEGVALTMSIRTRKVMEALQLPQVTAWKQFYYRFLGDYHMTLEIAGTNHRLEGEMLHEFMLL